MKPILLAVGAVKFATGMAYGQAETARIDKRQGNQEQRIDRVIASAVS